MKRIIQDSVLKRYFAVFAVVFQTTVAGATVDLASSFSLDGQLYMLNSEDPLLDADVRMTVQILDPSKTCVLLEETHKVSTAGTQGYYRLLVGSSAQVIPADPTIFPRRGSLDSAHTLTRISQNTSAMTAKGASCATSSYTPQAGDGRFLRLLVTPSSNPVVHVLTPDTEIGSVPQALVAETVQGYKANQLLILDPSKNTTQATVSNFFAGLDGSGRLPTSALPASIPLSNLGSGSADSTKFLRGDGTWGSLPAGGAPDWSSVTGKPTSFPPSVHTHSATEITSGELAIARGGTGLGAACADGQVLKSVSGAWVCGTDENTTNDTSKLPLSGGTMTGPLNMGSQNLEVVGHITITAEKTLRLGAYDESSEATQIASLASGHEGSVWYNNARDSLKVWTGGAVRELIGSEAPTSLQNGQSLRWNEAGKRWEYFTAGAASSGIATLNGLSGNDQLFAVSTSGTALTWSSLVNTHTLHLPMADQMGVSAGLISKSQFDALNAKQAALPASSPGQFLRRGASDWESHLIQLTDLKNSDGTVNAFDLTGCGPTKTLQWVSAMDQVRCVDIAIDWAQVSGKPTLGSVTSVVAGAGLSTGGSNDPITGAGTISILDGGVTNAKIATGISASKITADVFDVARLGSGLADNTKFLRGDGTWSTLPAVTAPDWSSVTGKPASFAPSAHTHSATEITAGELAISHGGTGRSAACADGQVLKSASGAWICGVDDNADIWHSEASDVIRYDAGNVVIGTQAASPGYKLDIGSGMLHAGSAAFEGGSNDKDGPTFSFWKHRNYGAILQGDELGYFSFWGRDESQMNRSAAIVSQAEVDFTGGNASANLKFATRGTSDSDVVERVRITSVGRVGIGLDSPEEMLHVDGRIKATALCLGSDCQTSWPSGGGLVDASVTTAKLATEVSSKLLPAGTTNHFLKSDGTTWSGSVVKLDDLKNSTGGLSAFNLSGCGPTKTLGSFSAPLDQFSCVDIGIDVTKVTGAIAESRISVAGGVAGLDANARVPQSHLGSGTSSASTFLRGDGTWSTLPAAAAPDWSSVTGKPASFTPSTHTHSATEITSGELAISRGGTGRSAACTDGQVLKSSSGAWICANDANTDVWKSEPSNVIRYDAGNVVIGTQTASSGYKLDIGDGQLHAGSAAFESTTVDNAGPYFAFWKHRNYSAVLNEDVLGSFSFMGGNGAGVHTAASIASRAEVNFSGSDNRGNLIFSTRGLADTGPVERVRITSDGKVGIGTSAANLNPEKPLHVVGAVKADEICIGNDCKTSWSGSSMRSYKEIAGNYTVVAGDIGHLLNVTNGVTVTLPNASSVGAGFVVSLKRTAPTAVKLAASAGQTIDGLSALGMGDIYSSLVVVSTGTNWIIESRSGQVGEFCLYGNPQPGQVCSGGAIYLGELSPGATSGTGTDRYMTTPGGCEDSATPDCDGSVDVTMKSWNGGGTNYDIPSITSYTTTMGTGAGSSNRDATYGEANTNVMAAIELTSQGGIHAAARYCQSLVYGGHSDWYLPNRYELNLFWTHIAVMASHGLQTDASTYYWSSSESASSGGWWQQFHNGNQGTGTKSILRYIRCVRRF